MHSSHAAPSMRLLLLALALSSAAAPALHAQTSAPPASSPLARWWNGQYATGDWGGARQRLENRGVHLWLNYEQDLAGNVTGGDSRGVTNSGSIEFGALLHLDKLAGIPRSTLLARFIDRNGVDLSARRIGNFFPVQQDFGLETFMLQSLALEYFFHGNDNLSLKAGRMATGDDFAGADIYGLYMNNAFDGQPKALFTTNAFSSYPDSVWGARLAYAAPAKNWYAKAGVYQTNDRLYTGDKHGFQWDIRRGDGVMLVSEIGYTPGRAPAALPGNYHAGAYVSFWDIPRFDGLGDEDTSFMIYLHADQMLWRAPSAPESGPAAVRSVTAWSSVVFAPTQSVQSLHWQVSAGAAFRGLIRSRPQDNAVIGISHGHFGDGYALQQQALTGEYPTGETVIELAYRIKLNLFNTLQPGIQYIMTPDGYASRGNALVFGLRLYAVF